MAPPNQHFFIVSKDEWNTKEDTGKSMKNVLYVVWAEGTSNNEKNKHVALGIIKHFRSI